MDAGRWAALGGGLHLAALGCAGLRKAALGCAGLRLAALGCAGLRWAHSGRLALCAVRCVLGAACCVLSLGAVRSALIHTPLRAFQQTVQLFSTLFRTPLQAFQQVLPGVQQALQALQQAVAAVMCADLPDPASPSASLRDLQQVAPHTFASS